MDQKNHFFQKPKKQTLPKIVQKWKNEKKWKKKLKKNEKN